MSATRSPASTESSWWQPSEHGVITTHVTTRGTARPSCQDGDPPVAGVSSRVHRARDADHLLDTCLGWTEAEHAPRATIYGRPEPRARQDGGATVTTAGPSHARPTRASFDAATSTGCRGQAAEERARRVT